MTGASICNFSFSESKGSVFPSATTGFATTAASLVSSLGATFADYRSSATTDSGSGL